ncbi:dTDP-glucose 4,6-dehydratase [Dethiothermospora halolimnae]|uniref:dTDP-glucose 4,6-dehydratase n=1 Tax=Dethiothermospora halolimnae TaxID=3114390 RepID=UPI003CCC119C
MKTYLVTGGAGFIGSNFIRYLLNNYKEIKVINIDKLTYAGNLENLKGLFNDNRYEFIKGDICDKWLIEKIFNENVVDYIINFAAESHVDRSIKSPEVFIRTNILGVGNLLNVSKDYWENGGNFKEGKRFLQVSTDEVYGSVEDDEYFTEETQLDPHSPYSASKASADLLVKAYYDTYKMPINITRCSNNYGPYQFPEKLIPLVIDNCINKRKIPLYGDGLNIRDWLFVDDHCRAIDMVIKKGLIGEIYNIGGHNEKANIYVIKTIINYLKENFDKSITEDLIEYVEDRKGHDRRYAIDPNKIRKIGWEPTLSFDKGIIKTIKWYLKNKEWLDKVKNKDKKLGDLI